MIDVRRRILFLSRISVSGKTIINVSDALVIFMLIFITWRVLGCQRWIICSWWWVCGISCGIAEKKKKNSFRCMDPTCVVVASGIDPLQLHFQVTKKNAFWRAKDALGNRIQTELSFYMMWSFCLSSPSLSVGLQHGGFVKRQRLDSKNLHFVFGGDVCQICT